jgi:hypothetical protein
MARSRKKSMSQSIVSAATAGMPQPARKVLGNRLVAKILIIAVPVLFATGILSLQWVNGRPSVQFNRDRAQQIEKRASEKIGTLRDEIAERRKSGTSRAAEAGERISKVLQNETEGR